jgi:hypothetical protein
VEITIKILMTKPSINKPKFEDTPTFNMWQDREDMADVEHYVDQLRKTRCLSHTGLFDKLQIDIDMADEKIKSPSWHEDIINERMQLVKSGKAKFISIQELKDKNL